MSTASLVDVSNRAKLQIANSFSEHLKTLLQEKHLYQKIDIEVDQILTKHRSALPSGHQTNFDKEMKAFLQAPLAPAESQTWALFRGAPSEPAPCLLLSNVKLYCKQCKAREVYSPVWFKDLVNEFHKPNMYGERTVTGNTNDQLFVIAYQCQLCKRLPEMVVVRRKERSLVLEARSPMEEVEVPQEIPKPERHFFSDALIAEHAGKGLAGLFYLRTFIEQFARRVTGESGRIVGDDLLDAYAKTIPLEHRDNIPSLREWYDKLSEAIHTVTYDPSLFSAAEKALVKHFKIRDIYEIPETTPTTDSEESEGLT